MTLSSVALASGPENARVAAPEKRVVGLGVAEILSSGERARVFIFFESPEPFAEDLAQRRARVAAVQDRALAKLHSSDLVVKRRFATIPALAGEINAAGLRRLSVLDEIVRIDLDEGGHGQLAQAVPMINADDLRAVGLTGEGVTVALLDTGLDADHPDLADDLDGQACFCSRGTGCCPDGTTTQLGAGAAEDDHGHGSNIAGIVTSRGEAAPAGVASDARVVAVKVLDSTNTFCCSSDVIAGLDWIIDTRPDVDIVNISLGTIALFDGACDGATSYTLAFASAINTLRSRGTTTFAASGNNGSGASMTAPACVANAISVGAVYDANIGSLAIFHCTDETTVADKVTCFTNSNATTDLFAPGAPMTSSYLFGGASTFYGTSQASAAAAGCAADLLEASPMLTPAQIESVLKTTGVTVVDATNGLSFPRIDCLAARNGLICVDVDADGYGSPGAVTCPAGSVSDCNDTDVTVWHAPDEATALRLDAPTSDTALSWTAPVSGGLPSAMRYDVLRAETAADFAAPAVCIATNIGPDTSATDGAVPAVGTLFFYLVRAENSCGEGSLGARSDGSPRPGSPCP